MAKQDSWRAGRGTWPSRGFHVQARRRGQLGWKGPWLLLRQGQGEGSLMRIKIKVPGRRNLWSSSEEETQRVRGRRQRLEAWEEGCGGGGLAAREKSHVALTTETSTRSEQVLTARKCAWSAHAEEEAPVCSLTCSALAPEPHPTALIL